MKRLVALVAAVALLVVVCVSIASSTGASNKPIYMLCRDGKSAKPKQHPRNCSTVTAFYDKFEAGLITFNFQKLRWRNWGSGEATATGLALAYKTHEPTEVHLVVSATRTCGERTYYAHLLVDHPPSLRRRHVTVRLPPGACTKRLKG